MLSADCQRIMRHYPSFMCENRYTKVCVCKSDGMFLVPIKRWGTSWPRPWKSLADKGGRLIWAANRSQTSCHGKRCTCAGCQRTNRCHFSPSCRTVRLPISIVLWAIFCHDRSRSLIHCEASQKYEPASSGCNTFIRITYTPSPASPFLFSSVISPPS